MSNNMNTNIELLIENIQTGNNIQRKVQFLAQIAIQNEEINILLVAKPN